MQRGPDVSRNGPRSRPGSRARDDAEKERVALVGRGLESTIAHGNGATMILTTTPTGNSARSVLGIASAPSAHACVLVRDGSKLGPKPRPFRDVSEGDPNDRAAV
jgi:hypothetical protein